MKSFELSALMVDTHRNVYEAAASLFDSNTTLDLKDEYARGVTEMVMRVIGIDSDYKDEIAEAISTFTMTINHRDFARNWIENHGRNIYVGMREDIRKESQVPLSYDDVNTIVELIESVHLEIRFA